MFLKIFRNISCHGRIHCFELKPHCFFLQRKGIILILDKVLSCQTFACSHTRVWRKRYFGPQEGSASEILDLASYPEKYKSVESLNDVFGNDLPKGNL